ncbi:hypothetical protein CC1G_15745 [Coprinopsis cinerea okayama7|uniref:Uncharacterized protein n=1 Tax=Coprinopsis cinerea (strain Okayama-7 / 130 / ATCC MYA-4618 / FGSC 9003) TaxID=240176 RepID=D6RQJ2_COPC7|nr:hypothetical protein CC1G_15745 [Coprinopsis cinerea okayama7\|eukprot:XP_002910316.1 hypothetical protein CC1G_15745 [Coprinopsis cinerea okayama7\
MPPTTQQLQRDTLRIRRLRDEVHPDTYARAIPTLDLCLQYLRLDAIPDRPILPYALMDLAWAALMCLSKIVFVSTRKEVKEPLQKTTVAKVLPGFEGIIAWLDTCMAQRPHCRPEHGSYSRAAELLLGLLILDPSLEPLVHGSSVAMKLALKLWWNCTEDGSAVTVELTAQLLVGDPFVHLMFFIIQKTDLLFDYITSTHGGPRKFCYALVYRIKYLVALHQDKNLLDSLFIKHAMMVLNITRRAQTNQSLHRRLRKEHYLECWTVATNTIQPRLIQSDIHPQASSSVLSYFATSLLDIATAPGGHSVRGFTILLRSDIFPILVYLLRYSSPVLQHEDDRKRAKIFNMLGGYALYPRSCTALLRAINGIPQDAVDEIRAVPYLVDYWDGWTYTIELVANCRALALGFDNLPLDRLCSYSGVSVEF